MSQNGGGKIILCSHFQQPTSGFNVLAPQGWHYSAEIKTKFLSNPELATYISAPTSTAPTKTTYTAPVAQTIDVTVFKIILKIFFHCI